MFVTKLVDEFIVKLRLYITDRLQSALAGQDVVQLTQALMPNKRLATNPE